MQKLLIVFLMPLYTAYPAPAPYGIVGRASAIHPAEPLSDDDIAAEHEATELQAAAILQLTEGDQASI